MTMLIMLENQYIRWVIKYHSSIPCWKNTQACSCTHKKLNIFSPVIFQLLMNSVQLQLAQLQIVIYQYIGTIKSSLIFYRFSIYVQFHFSVDDIQFISRLYPPNIVAMNNLLHPMYCPSASLSIEEFPRNRFADLRIYAFVSLTSMAQWSFKEIVSILCSHKQYMKVTVSTSHYVQKYFPVNAICLYSVPHSPKLA